METYLKKTSKTLKKPLIKFNNASVTFGTLEALKNISFSISKGDFIYIIGPNGSGKTTLVKLLAGLVRPSTGSVNRYDKSCGYLPQMIKQRENFPITVKEVIYAGFNKQSLFISKKDKEKITFWLDKMNISNLNNSLMGNLSGGQQQRVLLIRALINNPELLILDEPTSALDPEFRNYFYKLINEVYKKGTTILFITHDLNKPLLEDAKVLEVDQVIKFFGTYKQYLKKRGKNNV